MLDLTFNIEEGDTFIVNIESIDEDIRGIDDLVCIADSNISSCNCPECQAESGVIYIYGNNRNADCKSFYGMVHNKNPEKLKRRYELAVKLYNLLSENAKVT